MDWKKNFEKLRQWIDDETEDKIPDRVQQAESMKSETEVFFQHLKKKIEEILQEEILRIPNTKRAYIPQKFAVLLNSSDYERLPAIKREFFEQNLGTIILEGAKEMAGNLRLTTNKIKVEIGFDATLEEDEIDVTAFAEDRQKTIENFEFKEEQIFSNDPTTPSPPPKHNETIDDLGTIDDFESYSGILYRVEIWQEGKKLSEFPIIQHKTTIGRDDSSKAPNLRLKTDNRKISGKHAEIEFVSKDEIWVSSLHKNPTFVSGKLIRKGEKEKLGADGEVQIYDFTLKIKLTK